MGSAPADVGDRCRRPHGRANARLVPPATPALETEQDHPQPTAFPLAELVERLDAASLLPPHEAAVAASLHVYGADLRQRGTSVRRCYRMPVR